MTGELFPEPLKVATTCKCRQEAEERRKAEEQARADMEQIKRLRINSLMDEKFRESTFDTFHQTKNNARNDIGSACDALTRDVRMSSL